MGNETSRRIIDGDGHIVEDNLELFEYLPPPYSGRRSILATPFFPTGDGFQRLARRVAGDARKERETPKITEWKEFLDQGEVSVAVLYPTAGLNFGFIQNDDWAVAIAQAYNDWLYDRYLKVDSRLRGIALIPLQVPELAAKELRRAVTDLGMVGALLPAVGLWEAYGHKSFWPVYEAAQELNCLLGVHGGSTRNLGLERLHTLVEARTLSHGLSQMIQMTSMMFAGVFDAFPKLRVAFCEAGVGWASYLVERMDMEFKNRRLQCPGLKISPSEHLQSGQIFISTEMPEKGLPNAVSIISDNGIFCATDFPHEPRHEFLENMEAFETRQDISEVTKQKILWDNPLRMYALE